MSAERKVTLLKKAAAALDNGEDPFSTSFLSENDVTLDECGDLADSLALGARLLVHMMRCASAGDVKAGTHLIAAAMIEEAT